MSRLSRIAITAGAVLAFGLIPFHPDAVTPLWQVAVIFALLLVAIINASFGVLKEANAIAKRLGEPYGSLILTISVLIIEIVLIASVMLGPTPAPEIGRDSVFSVMMIILNLVVGTAILIGYRKNGPQTFRRRGVAIYALLIAVFGGSAFLLPHLFKPYTGGFEAPWGLIAALAIGATYIAFLALQMGPWRSLFQEGSSAAKTPASVAHSNGTADQVQIESGASANGTRAASAPNAGEPESFWNSIPVRSLILVLFLVAISLLSEHLAVLIDFGVSEAGLPAALGGIVIAAIVFTPETMTSLSAALSDQMQRVVNLCLGAYVSTIGMTFPAVIILGLITGKEVVFGVSLVQSLLFLSTLALSVLSFSGPRTRWPYGVAHLALFALFLVTVFIH